MTLYEINQAMLSLIDDETGEISDIDAFNALGIEANEKIENTALWYKNLCSDIEAIKAEEKALAERRKQAENRAERLKSYLNFWLNGQKFETPRVKCSFRKTSSVDVDDEVFIKWAKENQHDDLLKYTAPTPNKTAIKAFIKDGGKVNGAVIATNQSLSIQ